MTNEVNMDTEKRLVKAELLLTLAVDFLELKSLESSGSSIVVKRIKDFLSKKDALVTLYIKPYTGPEKIKTIKEVRAATGKGLRETKELIEGGGIISEKFSLKEANALSNILGQYNAETEIRGIL